MWFETILAIGMVTSAVLAIYLKETVASVLSLSTMIIRNWNRSNFPSCRRQFNH